MAYTKTPETSTYQTKRIKLIKELSIRSSSVDYDMDYINCFFDVVQNKTTQELDFAVVKRAGVENFITVGSANMRGMHYWEDEDKLLVAYDNDIRVYTASTATLVATLSNVFTTTDGEVGFTEFLYDDTSVKIVVSDGVSLLTIDSANTVVTTVDADMPTPHLPQPVFLDGYIFLIKTGSADLYNSNLNDPTAWTAGNFISSEMLPDTIVRLAKLNNYLVTFGTNSIEYFWDAGNASGSPLQRNDTPIKLYGYLGGFAQFGNSIYFVGNSITGTPSVFMLEDFKLDEVESPALRKYLEVLNVSFEGIYGSVVSFLGHDFYVLSIEGVRTYVYDLKTKLWTRWQYQSEEGFDIRYAINVKQTTDYCSTFILRNVATILNFDPRIYQDRGTNYTMQIVTEREMFENYNQKYMHRLIVDADRPSSTASLFISWSDDDYQSYSSVVTTNLNQELPCIYRLGRFRRRAFKLQFTSNHPMRIRGLEVDLNMGQT